MIICITGPTGVGKTKLSIMLAKKYKGIVVNADATQIYKELNIGSAKVTEEEKEGIEHYLFDIRMPNEDYSIFDYQKDLRKILDSHCKENIIIVGGSGLYMTSGLYDYSFSERLNKDYSKYTNEELYKMCIDINPNLDIHPNNRRRLENYLDRLDKTEKEPKLLYDCIFIGLETDRDILYKRINDRVDEMFNNGLVDEVRCLYQKYGDVKILNRAIGYKELLMYLKGEISLSDAKELIKKNSRHYAKRQFTWFYNKMNIKFFKTDFNNFNNTYDEIVDYIEKTTH